MIRLLATLTFLLSFSILCHSQTLGVNQDRLEATIFKLSDYGKDENGVTNRVAFSDADIAGRQYVFDLMKEAGLDVSIDFAGNIIGLRAGTDPSKKPIAFGSHIDMVPNGGNSDGCLGSLAANFYCFDDSDVPRICGYGFEQAHRS